MNAHAPLEIVTVSLLLIPLSYLLTLGYRAYAIKKNVLDTPNHRSSHLAPTPRGGGISIILCYTLTALTLTWMEILTSNQTLVLLIASLPIAFIGLIDDHKPVPSSLRFFVHFMSAAAALYLLDNSPTIAIAGLPITLHELWIVPVAIGLTWLTNLYNFMDGIDGIASTEAIFVLVGAYLVTGGSNDGYLVLLFIPPLIGFLALNWAPAKIFMGDAGSGFLGAFLGILAIILAAKETTSLWVWIILLGTFIADASWTLVTRFASGQAWHQPHRSHSYQILSRRFNSHSKVNLGNLAVIFLWLTPLAYAAQHRPTLGIVLAVIAYSPLFLLAYKLKAGKLETTSQ